MFKYSKRYVLLVLVLRVWGDGKKRVPENIDWFDIDWSDM